MFYATTLEDHAKIITNTAFPRYNLNTRRTDCELT